ncbi:hypothetical protein [Hyalangium versicolor]|uniref:hypothetical protein n=1 Tax=Hyalangium versicolor TaxID=2861190 RepID=UPI001CCF1B62|nr:hypothetical protein [Hyalangium versicolor]
MRAIIIASISLTSLLAGSALAATEPESSAQSPEVESSGRVLLQGSGPFNSITEVKNYDAAAYDGWRTVTFVDGKVVQDLFGFGPATHNEYFLCADGRYWAVCSDPFSRSRAWDSPLLSYSGFQGADTIIKVDGVVRKWNTAALTQVVEISTCTGDSSPTMWSPYTYHLVTSWTSIYFGALIGPRTCP